MSVSDQIRGLHTLIEASRSIGLRQTKLDIIARNKSVL